MSLNGRLNRLEAALGRSGPYLSIWELLLQGVPVPEGFDPARDLYPRHVPMWHALVSLPNWLEKEGYADALEALEAGETGPEGLGDLLREQAGYDEKRRAWKRMEDSLAVGQLPEDANTRLLATGG
jgi:hypothetical protein